MSERRGTRPAGPQKFSAAIYRVGLNFCVDVPEAVRLASGGRVHVPVTGTVDGHDFRTTLVPRGGGRHRLFLNGALRKAAGVGEGDTVTLALKLDTRSRALPVPVELADALRKNTGALAALEALTPAHRGGLLEWIDDAKRAETRARRISRVLDHLLDR